MRNSLAHSKKAAVDMVRQSGATAEQYAWIIETGLLQKLLSADPESVDVEKALRILSLNIKKYSLEMLTQKPEVLLNLGRYSAVEKMDNLVFQMPVELGLSEAYLVGFGEVLTTSQVRARVTEIGHKFAPNGYLLAFGAQYPEIQEEFQIFSFGTEWPNGNIGLQSAFLTKMHRGRELNVRSYNELSKWGEKAKFLTLKAI